MKRTLSLLLVIIFSAGLPRMAAAESESLNIIGKRAALVGKAAAYGAGGGLIVGVASQVFKKKAKNIFMFGSLGLYAGILVGIYVISTAGGPAIYDGPDTYEDFNDFSWQTEPTRPSGLSGLSAAKNASVPHWSMQLVQLDF